MKIPSDIKDIKAIREFLTTIRTQVCGMADYLSEPWKTHFTDLKKHYDDAIAALPPTDAVPAAMEANHHLSCFYSCLANANALASMLGSALDSMVKKNAEAVTAQLASAVGVEVERQVAAGTLFKPEVLEVKVTEAIAAKTTAGELVPKEMTTQLCSAAKDLGLKEGEKKVRDEIAAGEARKVTINTRKAALQTCGLPIPDEKLEGILAGTDEEFKAVQATAEARIAALQKKGVEPEWRVSFFARRMAKQTTKAMNTKSKVGQAMRDARRRLGLTQLDLSQRVSCTESMVTKIETGRATSEHSLKEAIARELGIQSWEVGV